LAVALGDEKVVFFYIKIQTFYKNTESTILVLLCTTFDILLSNTFFVWLSSNRFSYIWEDLLRKAKFYVMKCNKNTWNYKNKDKLSCNKQAWANETYWIRQTSIYTKMA